MKVVFKKQKLEKIYNEQHSKQYKKHIVFGFVKCINYLESADNIKDLKNMKSLNFEKLKNYSNGDYSIRINLQYRIIFNILENEIKIIEITELSKHYQ